ncbi:MAG: T9SS type A sorting domain-containing protein, partial [Roseivirga sp.]|nr:T9SS type A sorting domain-containing protein [Roseivirga sp.]
GFGEINIVSETEITQVTACDSKGNVFTIPAISRNEFDVSALSPGLYFLSISTPNETRQRSFIKSDN